MKKLIISLCAVACAMVTHAAMINWAVNTEAWTLTGGVAPAQGTQMWLVDRAYESSITAALKDKDVVDFSSATWQATISGLTGVYGTASTTDDAGALDPEVMISHDDLTVGKDFDLATLIIDNVTYDDKILYTVSLGTGNSFASTDVTSLDTANFHDGLFSTEDGWMGWDVAQSTPEPTSGLLMLIGMAGLALRRRRA